MKISAAKENILKRIRQALTHSTPVPFPQSEGSQSVFLPAEQDNDIEFAVQFGGLGGKFIFCTDEEELIKQLKELIAHNSWTNLFCTENAVQLLLQEPLKGFLSTTDLADCNASITGCELLVARTGSIMISSAQTHGRTGSVYAPVHICIAYTNQLVYDIREGLESIKAKYKNRLPSLITLATGPSRTADIEKTLVVGVHGPKEVYVFLVDAG